MSELILGRHIPDELTTMAREIGPEPGTVLAEMEAAAVDEGFPIVGPEVGGWLAQLARIRGAERILELGSGFGYSACWFARALPDDGEIILTEFDADLLDRAEHYLERVGASDLGTFEAGDAVEIAARQDDPFDVVLIDIDKHQYPEAFETVRDLVAPGGLIVADNTITGGRERVDGSVHFETVRTALAEPDFDVDDADLAENTRVDTEGVITYVERLRDDPDFESTLLPLGDGLTVSTRIRE
ncbi:O-methyltransferase [Halobacteria archaeon AArc-dxtr1]|nr:O-methyltransferase [Halobacteria archaeon AArc-dxtr1]